MVFVLSQAVESNTKRQQVEQTVLPRSETKQKEKTKHEKSWKLKGKKTPSCDSGLK